MAKAWRKRRWAMWLSIAGLSLTLALAAFSELRAVSYRENTYGVANRLLLYRSSISVVYRPGPDTVQLTGIEVFQPGWSIARFLPRDAYLRRWVPFCRYSNQAVDRFWQVIVPLWIPAAVFAAGVWWARRGEWAGADACRCCGYNIQGVVGGKCPECGRVKTLT